MPLLLMGIKLLLEQGMRVLGLNKRDPVIIDLFLGEVMSFERARMLSLTLLFMDLVQNDRVLPYARVDLSGVVAHREVVGLGWTRLQLGHWFDPTRSLWRGFGSLLLGRAYYENCRPYSAIYKCTAYGVSTDGGLCRLCLVS
uniref:Uncharacterized protein n=1 Tax=Picea glauca TaxID=3330 RepID=A0A101LX11_PICGL|nr:hypothetical protein ABT39_MTgene6359 [Picea glauca]QHR86320.1 hypothetical protein Q903MT_gene319 [Picea sitchensis]